MQGISLSSQVDIIAMSNSHIFIMLQLGNNYFAFVRLSQIHDDLPGVVTAGMEAVSVLAVERRVRNVTSRPVLTMDHGASGASVVRSAQALQPQLLFHLEIFSSQSCDGGTKRRVRDCVAGDRCEGEAEEVLECNEDSCPAFSQWSPWSQCTQVSVKLTS